MLCPAVSQGHASSWLLPGLRWGSRAPSRVCPCKPSSEEAGLSLRALPKRAPGSGSFLQACGLFVLLCKCCVSVQHQCGLRSWTVISIGLLFFN